MQQRPRSKNSKHASRSGLSRYLLQWTHPVRHALLLGMLDGLRLLTRRLSHGAAVRLGGWLGSVAALVDRKKRRLAERQLREAGLADTSDALRRLSGQVYRNLGMNALEWLHSLAWTPQIVRGRVEFDADIMEKIERARAYGRGSIFVALHMGNWELLLRGYHAHTGRVPAAIMAQTSDPALTHWIIRWREVGGGSRLLLAHDARAILRHLHGGGGLAVLADQDSRRSHGIFVDFFSRPALTPSGPASLARRTGAPLLPVAIVRDSGNPCRHHAWAGEPILPNPALDEEADIRRMTQAFTAVFEEWIREHPAQWVWIHDRWHHRPGVRIKVRHPLRHTPQA